MGPRDKTTKIEITNETVAVWEDDQVVSISHTTAVAQGLFGHRSTPNGLLPMAVRYVGPGARLWVWERPPQQLSLRYVDSFYTITLPWTAFAVDTTAGTVRVFARPGPLRSLDDDLAQLPLPGINEAGKLPIMRMAMGSSTEVVLTKVLAAFQELHWMGKVPEEWRPPELRMGSEHDMLEAWAKAGAVDVVRWGWIPRLTLNELTQSCPGGEDASSVREMIEKAVGR